MSVFGWVVTVLLILDGVAMVAVVAKDLRARERPFEHDDWAEEWNAVYALPSREPIA